MTAVVVNGVDLELLRKHVKEGYNASSATVIALIQIALAEPGLHVALAQANGKATMLSQQLDVTRYALASGMGQLARIVAARMSPDQDALVKVVDETIEKYVRVMPSARERVH
ncbi:hypothetical protein EBAPG3_010370 [Nitrosospira lacus]|uniref:Uncharacterized protein n=1 Tax=Nitrosospira lacus TaxID=1288494 RepID=A0A1W6SQS7_9PROT|nr:hypothetical protein [Nitrosospira lacus]ARO88146.1 hypothetical protein EBAPG3_010370 [Nitrosospira lacus]